MNSSILRKIVLVAAGVVLASSCSVEGATPPPDCETGESATIVAQSVPTADFVPCLRPPTGWEVETISITQDGTSINLHSDRAGSDAAHLQYMQTCDPKEAIELPSTQEGVKAFEHIKRTEPSYEAERYYIFNGGCVWWEFRFDANAPADLAVSLQDSLGLITRDFLNESISENFIDEEL